MILIASKKLFNFFSSCLILFKQCTMAGNIKNSVSPPPCTNSDTQQECNARKVNCSCVLHIETSSLWPHLVNKNRTVFVQYPRRLKALNFDNFDNSHNSFLRPEQFPKTRIFVKMDSMSGFDIHFVLHYRPARDSTLQYKRCVHF